MKKFLPLLLLFVCSTASKAQGKLTLELSDGTFGKYNISELRCIDFTDATKLRIYTLDGTMLTSSKTSLLKMNFTDDVATTIEPVSAIKRETSESGARKFVVDGKLMILTSDGAVVNTIGQRMK